MSDRFQTKIEIGGQLARAHMDELDDMASEREIDWSDRATREDIEEASATRTALELTGGERLVEPLEAHEPLSGLSRDRVPGSRAPAGSARRAGLCPGRRGRESTPL